MRSLPPPPLSLRGRGGRFLLAFLLLLTVAAPIAHAAAPIVVSSGTYTDAAGAQHAWTINAAHALIWDGKPFLPVGGVFQARSWTATATDEDWASDQQALAALKAQNVTDLYVQPARGGITGVPPARIQRLLDALDAGGFTYGISIHDGPPDPLVGYVVRPGAFRQAGVAGGGLLRFPLDNLFSSLYFVVDAASGEMVAAGEATLVAEGARVSVAPRTSESVVFLVPERIFLPGGNHKLPNLWDGFDSYRDALLTLFAQVKLGPGFRFFVDALPPALDLDPDTERLIPSGAGFRTEWSAWLARRYKRVDDLHTAWAMPERDLRTVAEAADLIPLWAGGKGIPALYSKSTGKTFRVDFARPTTSAFWDDLDAFKAESVRGYMNHLADVLKRQVADVPVVYRWKKTSPLFTHLSAAGGFDGVGIEAYGQGAELVTRAAGYALAQAREAPKTLWLPVTGTQTTRAPSKPEKGYASRAALFADLDWLREIGAKGFYVDGLRIADPERQHFSLADAPEQLSWLQDYAGMLAAISNGADQRPKIVPYPRSLAVASLRPLPGGSWWLPTDQPATVFDFGSFGRAYGLSTEQGIVYYLWNPHGPREIRLRLPDPPKGAPDPPKVDVIGAPPGKIHRNVLTITVGPEPVSIRNLASLPIPLDLVPEMIQEGEALLALARQQKRQEAVLFQQRLSTLKAQYKQDIPLPTYTALEELLPLMRATLRPYLWIEAEATGAHSFDENQEREGASGGRVLTVGERSVSRPPLAPTEFSPATATYSLAVRETGTYQLWTAATPNAPLTFRVDGQPIDLLPAPETRGGGYAGGLTWMHWGAVTFKPGLHQLELRADGPGTVDTLLLIPGDFTPDGPVPPPVLPPKPSEK